MSTTPTWRVLIADDEPLARARIRQLLQAHPAFAVVAECATGESVLECLDGSEIDVLFIDIRMPGLDGVRVVESLFGGSHAAAMPAIVFVTAYDLHAARAFDLEAIDYLVKPVDIDRFERALGRVTKYLDRRASADAATPTVSSASKQTTIEALARRAPESHFAKRFPVRDAKGIYFVAADDLERVEADGNYVVLVEGGRRHLMRETLRRIETRLDPARFVRVHRSAIVRIDCIRHLEPWGHGEYLITLTDGTRLTSSRTCSDGLKRLMQ